MLDHYVVPTEVEWVTGIYTLSNQVCFTAHTFSGQRVEYTGEDTAEVIKVRKQLIDQISATLTWRKSREG